MHARFLILSSLPMAALLALGACSSATPDVAATPPGSEGPAFALSVADASSDAGADADGSFAFDAQACVPTLPPGFAPAPVSALVNKVCSAEQITDFVAVCLGTDTSFCSMWTQDRANDACFHYCLVSPYSSAVAEPGMPAPPPMGEWGPIIDTQNPGTTTWFNMGGCIGTADPTQAKCAQDLDDRFQCEYAACTAGCPIPTNDSSQASSQATFDFQNCVSASAYGACQTYATAVATDCTLSTPDAGPAAFCYSVGPGNTAALTQLITQQCGM